MARKAEVIFVGDADSLVRAAAASKAAIKSVQDQASKKSGLDSLPTLGGNIATAAIAAAPAVVGLAGALGGLAASAAAAAGGAGAVGAGGMGALVVGLGSIALVAKPAAAEFKKVTTALDAYNLTLATHGVTAKQSAAAQAKLNAVVGQNGGAPVLAAAKAWDALGNSFSDLTAPGRASAFQVFNEGIATMGSLLPTVAAIANKSMAAFAVALQKPLAMLASSDFKGILTSLGNTFAKAIGPGLQGAAFSLLAFSRIAQAAGPYVVQLVQGLDHLAQKFAASTGNSTKLNATIAMLVSNTKSWIVLAGSLGRLVFDFFRQGVSSGQGMVNSLTQVVNKWDAWVRSAHGSAEITNFFRESAQFAHELFVALGPVVQALTVMSVGPLPVYVSLMSNLKNIMGPLTYGFVAYKIALTAATAATKAAEALGSPKLFGGIVPSTAAKGASVAAPAAAASGGVWMTAPGGPKNLPGAPAAVESSVLGSIKGGLSTAITRGAQGLIIGTVGSIVSQAVGSAIHGSVGAAVKSIGTDASIGAGLGAFFGPAGIAGGAVIGGLVGSIHRFIGDHAAQQGKEFAQKFTADLPGAISQHAKDALARTVALTIPHAALPNTAGPGTNIPAGRGGGAGSSGAGINRPDVAAFFNQGYAAGKAVVEGLKSVKTPSTQILFADFLTKLKQLPKQAQPEAAKVMLQYAHGLEANKQLPKGAVNSMIALLENQFPSFRAYLKNQGLQSDSDFAKALKFTNATATLKNTLASYRTDFGDMAIDKKITDANINKNTETAMVDLRTIIVTSVGQTRKDAEAEFKKLQQSVEDTFTAMGGKVAAAAGDMRQSVVDGSALAYKDGSANWTKFAQSVGSAMKAGVLSTDEGAKIIGDSLNAVLKSFGEAPLSLAQIQGLGPAITQAVASGQVSSGAAASPHAGGGLVQFGRAGDKGRDNIGVNFGGVPIAVGSGEVGAVLNHEQQGVANALMAPVGGLRGLFQKHKRPHYMAGGGIVGNIGAMISRANFDTSLHQPYLWGGGHGGFDNGPWDCSGAVSDILHAGGVLNAPRVSGDFMNYGLPGPGAVTLFANPTHVYMSIDGRYFGTSGSNPGGGAGWFPGGPRPGFAVRHIGGGGTGGAFITVPKVLGSGTIPRIVRKGLGKMGNAASAYLAAHAFSGAFGGGNAMESAAGIGSGSWTQVAGQIASKHGWDKGQLQEWWNVEQAEDASLSLTATNPSGAYGLAQMLAPGGVGPSMAKYRQYGGDPATIVGQLTGMANYIAQTYGNPANAMAHERAHHWYSGGGMLPWAGAFKNGGVVPRTGLGLLHKDETVIPARGMATGGLLYPLDAQIATLTDQQTALQGQTPFTLSKAQIAANVIEIAKLKKQLAVLSREGINLPTPASGKSGNKQRLENAQKRKDLANQRLTIEQKISKLSADDKAKGNAAEIAKSLAKVESQLKSLNQLKAFTDAIAAARTAVKDLAAQAAQAWATIQTGRINTEHDNRIASINNGLGAELAAMQAQDANTQAAATLEGLNKTLTDAQFLAAHSGGQTHLDALQQVKDAQAAIDAFYRQERERQLQDNITAATKQADDAQTVALAGLTQQTADYQSSLDAQFSALTDSLAARKESYAQWAADVNAILSQYGLSVTTDASAEATVGAGPGPLGTTKLQKGLGLLTTPRKGRGLLHRASGGPVEPGYVYRVGEQGPEDVAFGRSGTVMTASQTRRGNGGPMVHIERATFTGTRAARAFADRLAYRAAIGTA